MIQPVLDYIVLKPYTPEISATGQIHLPHGNPLLNAKLADVLAVGPGRPSEWTGSTITYPLADGSTAFSPVKVGDRVQYHAGAGTKASHDGEETLWILPRDIMGIVTE